MIKNNIFVVLFGLTVGCWLAGNPGALCEEPMEFDQFGGLKSIHFGPGEYFRTEHDGKRWWLVTPEGNAYLSIGVNCVHSNGDSERGTRRRPYNENVLDKHGSVEKWKEVTLERLEQWGVNTLAGWSSDELRDKVPYTAGLGLAPGGWASRQRTPIPDFFGPAFEEYVRERVAGIGQHADDPYLIGYFLANELPWAMDYRLGPDLFEGFMSKPADAPGKKKVVEFLKKRYETPQEFSKVWEIDLTDWAELGNVEKLKPRMRMKARNDREAFSLEAARQYFKVTAEAVRAVDPNHLILGCRFIWQVAPQAVVKACGEYCDVVSINSYETGILGKVLLPLVRPDIARTPWDKGRFTAYHELTNKPLMITEFSFRGDDSGLPNSYPPPLFAGPTAKTQKDRAAKYKHYVSTWASQPYFVGFHWFQYMDQPKAGRFDGENCNFGLVNITDEPYADFIEVFAETNKQAWTLHAAAGE